MSLLLEGIRILDLTWLLPGPFCTMILADLGAEVVKLEEPVKGDYLRLENPRIRNESVFFLNLNRNKKSLTLNIKVPLGKDIFKHLCKGFDVVVEGFRPGVMDRLGLGYEVIKEINPKIIYCSMTGYGQNGPYKNKVGHDVNYIGFGGVLSITGPKGGPPVIPGVQIGDLAGGALYSAIGILAALLFRQKTGRGQYIDVSMLDGIVSLLPILAGVFFAQGQILNCGDFVIGGKLACYNIYRTKDNEYITIGALEPKFWANFCHIIGREDLIKDQFSESSRQEEIKAILVEIFSGKNRVEWLKLFNNAEVCVGPVNSISEVFADPQVVSRKMLTEIQHPVEGVLKQIRSPIRFSESPPDIRTPPPLLGEHTEQILEWAGYDKEKIRQFHNNGVI